MDCKNSAIKLLTFRDRTEKELRDRLTEKGFEEGEIEETLELLKGYGYIDDERYAKKFVSDGINVRGHGPGRIKIELLKKGVDREIIEAALENENPDPREQIAQILGRRFSDSDLSNPKERSRILGYFARRGYAVRDVISAVNERCAFEDIDTEE